MGECRYFLLKFLHLCDCSSSVLRILIKKERAWDKTVPLLNHAPRKPFIIKGLRGI